MSKTFGAPWGGRTIFGKVGGSESSNVRPTFPGKWKSGRGNDSVAAAGGIVCGMGRRFCALPDCAKAIGAASTASAKGSVSFANLSIISRLLSCLLLLVRLAHCDGALKLYCIF